MVGPASQQDIELSALFNDAVLAYGEGKVLGILATKSDIHDHEISKREAEEQKESAAITTSTESPEAAKEGQIEEKGEENLLYNASGKKKFNYLLLQNFVQRNLIVILVR